MSHLVHELFFCEDITCFLMQYPILDTYSVGTVFGQHSGRWQLAYVSLMPEKSINDKALSENTRIIVKLIPPNDLRDDVLLRIPPNQLFRSVNIYIEPSWIEANIPELISSSNEAYLLRIRLASPSECLQFYNLIDEANKLNNNMYEASFWQLMNAFKTSKCSDL